MPQCPYCQSPKIKLVEPRRLSYVLRECQNPGCGKRFSLPEDEPETSQPKSKKRK